ncbi:beta-lactamase-like protein [Alteromonas macleodii str. 'Black Sea 11']|nr:beta-lactamase-like protein [Alteromonas macleodii str. 'Black Sea 11']NKX04486.1 MBL fold metallo-hydrolase [Alteromonadaceae bacterium A_SAG6]NKX18958.1 MBL fold metallo-hydrolase [Alteromonadaceae bacterium A_SAG5]NKX34311.1 MBL fold metallo-hydrolase [Alteromonadaceae bacterium A_SAG3]NKX68959.1 MBL fold metallo-hydrolase [Alteromonadaceae bacterium A_SAG7]
MTDLKGKLGSLGLGVDYKKHEEHVHKTHVTSLITTTITAILSFSSLAHASSQQAVAAENAVQSATQLACHNVSVQVLGSGGPELDDGRASSAYVVWVDDKARVLVDAGSGSSIQFGAAGASFESLEVILLSHLHTDHAVDLPSFVKGSYFTKRTENLTIMGPDGNDIMPSTKAYVSSLIGKEGAFKYLSSYTIEDHDDYTISTESIGTASFEQPFKKSVSDNINVEAMAVNHGPIPALAWKISANGCEVVFSGDTNDKQGNLARFAANVDLLVLHNAIDDDANQNAKNLHMTPQQIIDIAEQSKAKQILLSHIMKRSEAGLDALTEAITVVAEGRVYAAEDLMNISLSEKSGD